jgi:hypothetical protein
MLLRVQRVSLEGQPEGSVLARTALRARGVAGSILSAQNRNTINPTTDCR